MMTSLRVLKSWVVLVFVDVVVLGPFVHDGYEV